MAMAMAMVDCYTFANVNLDGKDFDFTDSPTFAE